MVQINLRNNWSDAKGNPAIIQAKAWIYFFRVKRNLEFCGEIFLRNAAREQRKKNFSCVPFGFPWSGLLNSTSNE
jgi:hypothetical protein